MHLVSSSPSSSLQHTGSGQTDEGVEGLLCLSLLSPGVCSTQRPGSGPRSLLNFVLQSLSATSQHGPFPLGF